MRRHHHSVFFALLALVALFLAASLPAFAQRYEVNGQSQLQRWISSIILQGRYTRLVIAIVCFLVMAARIANAQAVYTVLDLGTLSADTQAFGINNQGQVVGQSLTAAGYWHAFRTEANSPINPATDDLGTLGGNESFALSIDSSGNVTGYADLSGGVQRSFLYSGSGPMQDLGIAVQSYGEGINAGQIAGYSIDAQNLRHAFYYANGSNQFINNTLGGSNAQAYAVNISGQVAGSATTSAGYSHAFLSTGASLMTDLQTLGGTTSIARAINDSGQVVGFSLTSAGATHAFRTESNSPINPATDDLGTLGGTKSVALAINKLGQVVGYSYTSSGATHAFVWDSKNGMQDLNNLLATGAGSGWTLQYATAINDGGQIAGYGVLNGQTRGFLLTSTLHGIDISKSAGAVSSQGWSILAGLSTTLPWNSAPNNWNFVVVDSFQGVTQNQYAAQQLAGARAVGLSTGIYVFLNFTDPSVTGAQQVQYALNCIGKESNYISFIALDVEEKLVQKNNWNGGGSLPSAAARQVIRDIISSAYSAIPTGVQPVIYTKDLDNNQVWDYMTGWTNDSTGLPNPFIAQNNSSLTQDVPLWDTQYNTTAGTSAPYDSLSQDWTAYGGWTQRQGRQFEDQTGTDAATLASQMGVPDVDLDVMAPSLFTQVQPVLLPVVSIAFPSTSTGAVFGGKKVNASVAMSGPGATGGVTVGLSSSNSSVAWPVDSHGNSISTLLIPTSGTTAKFSVQTAPVDYNPNNPSGITIVFITGSYNGQTASAAIIIEPPALSKLTLSSSSVPGGTSLNGTIVLTGKTAVATSVTVSSTNPAATPVDANGNPITSVTVPAGSSTTTLTIQTKTVSANTTGAITAKLRTTKKSAALTVTPS